MKFPILLYEISSSILDEKKLVNKSSIITNNCWYFYSYQLFSVEIFDISYRDNVPKSILENPEQCLLFSVKQNGSNIVTQEGISHTGNFGYTLYIPIDGTKVILKLTNSNNEIEYYTVELKLDNITNETNEHYDDLLVNYGLPTFKQIEECIPDEFEKRNLIKRLLLEYQNILKFKGTKKSIDQFFEFLGYVDANLTVFDVYLKPDGSQTISPDTIQDIKTADYHVLYDNFTENTGLDSNNLPIRNTLIQNLEIFSQHLIKAISLANTYFTAEEQLITFFGLNYSSNIVSKPSITSTTSQIIEHDVYYFRKTSHIDIINYAGDMTFANYLIKNCFQKDNVIYKSEVKTYLIDILSKNNNEIYAVDAEIFDNQIEPDMLHYERLFACALHINIDAPNTYVKFEILNISNPLSKYTHQETTLQIPGTPLNKILVLVATSTYKITVYLTDNHGNTEKYFYQIMVNNDIQRIDFQTFNTSKVYGYQTNVSNSDKSIIDSNKIDLDFDTPQKLTERPNTISSNYILPNELVPTDLSTYFNASPLSAISWLSENRKADLKPMSVNTKINLSTETIPMELFDSWIDVIGFKYDSNYDLKIRVYDNILYKTKIISFVELYANCPNLDKLYIMLMDIYDYDDGALDSEGKPIYQSVKTPYYLITTTETGLDLKKGLFDLVLVNKNDPTIIKSIFEDNNTRLYKHQIPVNYDFPLFSITSDLVPTFTPYISNNSKIYKETIHIDDDINGNPILVTLPIVRSLYPRMINMESSDHDTFYLKIGDVVMCRLNSNFVVNERDIVWKIKNSFTGKILFQSDNTYGAVLKYRVDINACFDVICTFKINGLEYNINKKSLFSSFINN